MNRLRGDLRPSRDVLRKLTTRRVLPLGLFVAAAIGLAACAGGPPPGTGDPGNLRLHVLRDDPVFSTLPPESHRMGPIQLSSASWDTTYGGWAGPTVTVQFTSALTIQQVFDFYATRAERNGWKPNGGTDFGLPDGWDKRYRSGYTANLSLHYGAVRALAPDTVDSQPYDLGAGADAIYVTPTSK
jgi:hypothetical protein